MGKPAVDLRLQRRDRPRRRAGTKTVDRGFDLGGISPGVKIDQRLAQGGELAGGHHRIGEFGIDRIGAVHGLPGQSEVSADLARRTRQQKGAADIRKEPEADFGHREFCLFGHDAMAAMGRQPDAAAHHDAVHEGDIGFWEPGDAVVEDIFLAPQDLAEIALDLRTLIQGPDVAAGAQAALAGAFQKNQANRRIGLEVVERLVDVATHLQRHGVDRLRPVEADHADGALAPRDQIRFGDGCLRRHRAPSISLRATIRRMISLVPSRIWCTRRSRTIFSMPYSLR